MRISILILGFKGLWNEPLLAGLPEIIFTAGEGWHFKTKQHIFVCNIKNWKIHTFDLIEILLQGYLGYSHHQHSHWV